MMRDKKFENKVNRDVDRTKKDIATLGDDGVTGLSRKYDQLVDGARDTLTGALETFNKGVGQGLSQYNAKVQDVANRVPGNIGEKIAGYPWVTITMSLAFGLLLGMLLKPGRQPVG